MIGTPLSTYGFSMVLSLTFTGVAMATSLPSANSAQIILRDKDQATCSLDVPDAGSGLTYRYELVTFGSKCHGFTTRSIEFVELPSALKVFMSDDDWCSDSKVPDQSNEKNTRDFWLKLKTTKKSTTVGINEITYLLTYNANTIIGPGLMMEGKYEKPEAEARDKLSCIKLVASAAGDAPALPPKATESNRSWSAYMNEKGSNFSCASNQIMTGRHHIGDENGDTRYECATAIQSGAIVVIQKKVWSSTLKEFDGIYYVCPINTIMTGREHADDENGNTKYECATATNADRELTAAPHDWSNPMRESVGSQFTCPANQFLIGRWHKNDENGDTRYRCATLQ